MKPQSSSSNNKIPMSVKGRKKLLAPLNIKNNNQSLISTSTKDSIESKKINSSRDYLEYENDKKEDFIFLSKLSEREKTFFEVRAADIYNFLKELNLIRYIESFINDGFETKEDLMEIQEDYFLENKNFNKNQQKKILDKAKELLNEYNQKQKNESISMSTNNSINKSTTINRETGIGDFPLENKINENNNDNKSECNFIEIGIGNGDINNYYLTNKINRCWTCFNKLKDKNYIEVKYEESMITRIVRFCSEKCKNKFELNIYEICDNCKIKYDKSKGEYIYLDKHFHSQKCLDEFINKNNINKNQINNNDIIKEEEQEEQEDIYDPMDDF
jgi:hypothetical protein